MYHDTKKKQLILVRHAHAISTIENSGDDQSRPLSKSGEKVIAIMVRYLWLIGIRPDMVLSSTAKRATMTAQYFIDRFHIDHFQSVQALYDAYVSWNSAEHDLYLSLLRSVPDGMNTLLGVGHGENIEKCVEYFTGESMMHMEEGSLVVLTLRDNISSWNQTGPCTMSIVYYLTPEFLKLESLA